MALRHSKRRFCGRRHSSPICCAGFWRKSRLFLVAGRPTRRAWRSCSSVASGISVRSSRLSGMCLAFFARRLARADDTDGFFSFFSLRILFLGEGEGDIDAAGRRLGIFAAARGDDDELAAVHFVGCGSRVGGEGKRCLPKQLTGGFVKGAEFLVEVSCPDEQKPARGDDGT